MADIKQQTSETEGFSNPLAATEPTRPESVPNVEELASLSLNVEKNVSSNASMLSSTINNTTVARRSEGGDDIEVGDQFTHFDSRDFPFDQRPNSASANARTTSGPGLMATKYVRIMMFFFFSLYLLFAILIELTNNISHTHKEVVLTLIAELGISEPSVRRLFTASAAFLGLTACLGFAAFLKKNYRFFLAFSFFLLFTIVFTLVSLSISVSNYSQMEKVAKDETYFKEAFAGHLKAYNWTSLEDKNSIYINKFQLEFRCCGGERGFHDWENHPKQPEMHMSGVFPFSCCRIHFSNLMVPAWCGYEQVEQMRACPTSFRAYLQVILHSYKALNALLTEALTLQVLSIGVFLYLIFRFDRNMAAQMS